AAQIALGIDDAINYENAERHRRELTEQRDRWRVLLEVHNALIATRDLPELMQRIAPIVRGMIAHDHLLLTLFDEPSQQLRVAAFVPDPPPDYKAVFERITQIPLEGSAPGLAFTSRQPLLIRAPNPSRFTSDFTRAIYRLGVKSACCVPLVTAHRTLGVLIVSAHEEERFSEADLDLLVQIG